MVLPAVVAGTGKTSRPTADDGTIRNSGSAATRTTTRYSVFRSAHEPFPGGFREIARDTLSKRLAEYLAEHPDFISRGRQDRTDVFADIAGLSKKELVHRFGFPDVLEGTRVSE